MHKNPNFNYHNLINTLNDFNNVRWRRLLGTKKY